VLVRAARLRIQRETVREAEQRLEKEARCERGVGDAHLDAGLADVETELAGPFFAYAAALRPASRRIVSTI